MTMSRTIRYWAGFGLLGAVGLGLAGCSDGILSENPPNIIVAEKLWIAWPPKTSSASNAPATVTWVMIERDSVALIEMFSRSSIASFLYLRSISRMRS